MDLVIGDLVSFKKSIKAVIPLLYLYVSLNSFISSTTVISKLEIKKALSFNLSAIVSIFNLTFLKKS
ncbi:hypothetical protein [Mycoplasmopsis felis]